MWFNLRKGRNPYELGATGITGPTHFSPEMELGPNQGLFPRPWEETPGNVYAQNDFRIYRAVTARCLLFLSLQNGTVSLGLSRPISPHRVCLWVAGS